MLETTVAVVVVVGAGIGDVVVDGCWL